MNQDQVKDLLLTLDRDVPDFLLRFTGKESRKVNGLYKPESREILIHNRNFTDDNAMVYTAIHEFAHHVHFTRHPGEVSRRAHTNRFWDIFHGLLERAEQMEIYRNVFDDDPAFRDLTHRIRREFIGGNGRLMKDFGALLIEAHQLCRAKNALFEDYTERVLGMTRGSARSLMNISALNLDESLGFDRMKVVASIRNPSLRMEAQESLLRGGTPAQVRQRLRESRGEPVGSLKKLQALKLQLERRIMLLSQKLTDVERRLTEIASED